MWTEIVKPVALCGDYDDAKAEAPRLLLKLKIAVNRYEEVKVPFNDRKQFSVGKARPTLLRDSRDDKTGEALFRFARDTLIQKHPNHATESISLFLISSRTSMTCSRDTVGKSSRNRS